MTYADKPLDQNPLWNAAYHLRFAYEYMVQARTLDSARQNADHYRYLAVQQIRDAAAALGLELVEKPAAAAATTTPATVVALPFNRVAQ